MTRVRSRRQRSQRPLASLVLLVVAAVSQVRFRLCRRSSGPDSRPWRATYKSCGQGRPARPPWAPSPAPAAHSCRRTFLARCRRWPLVVRRPRTLACATPWCGTKCWYATSLAAWRWPAAAGRDLCRCPTAAPPPRSRCSRESRWRRASPACARPPVCWMCCPTPGCALPPPSCPTPSPPTQRVRGQCSASAPAMLGAALACAATARHLCAS